MDGLEATEIDFSFLKSVIDYRIESEYFSKRFLASDLMFSKMPTNSFDKVAKVINGRPYSSESFNDQDGLFVSKIGDVTNKRDIDKWEKVTRSEFEKQKGEKLRDSDILMTLTGDPPDVGKVNLIDCDQIDCTWNQRVAKINRKNELYISNNVLYSVLSSNYIRNQMERFAKGIRQRNLGNECFEHVLLPSLSESFQHLLDMQISQHKSFLRLARDKYNIAEQLLLAALDIVNIDNEQVSISIKSIDESFDKSGRLDAEYYQPKYDELFIALKRHETKPLGGKDGIVTIKKSIEPGSDAYGEEGIPFVRVSDITKFGISDPSIMLSNDIVEDVTVLYPKKDTILFSKDGSVGIAYKVEKDLEVVTSGALLHLTVKKPEEVLPDYLTLVLNSQVVQLQAERDSNGAIIQHWKPSEIEKVIIPVLDIDVQKQIAKKVQKSFALRHQSKQFLENAKRAVEIAIEQDEEKAMEWLKGKGVEC